MEDRCAATRHVLIHLACEVLLFDFLNRLLHEVVLLLDVFGWQYKFAFRGLLVAVCKTWLVHSSKRDKSWV